MTRQNLRFSITHIKSIEQIAYIQYNQNHKAQRKALNSPYIMCRSFISSPTTKSTTLFQVKQQSQVVKNEEEEVVKRDTTFLPSNPLELIKSKHCVHHNYHEHAYDEVPANVEELYSKGGVAMPFPQKLYEMLDTIEHDEPHFSNIIRWQPHGRCFLVLKPKDFATLVLPRFFQQKKYASFQRQLNLYGFNRITRGPDRGSYYHELFLRGKPFLCHGIHRIKVKGTGTRMASNPDEEPDFYSMPAMESSTFTSKNYNDDNNINTYSTIQKQENDCPIVDQDTNHGYYSSSTASLSRETSSLDDDDHEYVFNNMPFHIMEGFRRNSLCRRNSLLTSITSSSVDLYDDGSMEEEDEPDNTSSDDNVKQEDEDHSDAAFFQDMQHFPCLVDTGPLYDDDELGQLLEQIVRGE